jgi:predicted DNA-binding transcriptional regulator YafY
MRADRLLSILLLLQTKGRMTAQELAERLEVSERTIYRDLDALSIAGVPVYAERGPGGGCALLESYRTNLTGLTETEVKALFMFSIPGPLSDLGMSKAFNAALLKLSAALPPTQQDYAEHVRQRLYLDPVDWSHSQEQEAVPHLQTLQEAVWQDRRLNLTYRRADGSWVKRLVDPYSLVSKASTWYMVGEVMGRMVVFRVSRIEAAMLVDSHFERQPGFDLAAFWADWCAQMTTSQPPYPVSLRVTWEALPLLPQILGERAHALLERAGPPDRDGATTLNLTFESFEAARSSILSFGPVVEVLEPVELRHSVMEQATRIIACYARQAAVGD